METEIEAIPAANVIWLKNEQIIDINLPEYEGRYTIVERKGGIYQLLIKNCKLEDIGAYKCIASNKYGEINCSSSLIVISAPVFTKKFDQIDGVEKCDVKIDVTLNLTQITYITWSKNSNEIDTTKINKYELTTEKKMDCISHTLTIKILDKNDIGKYQCVVSNDAGRATCIGKVSVHPLTPPKFITPLNKELLLPENKNIELAVRATGIPVPRITWFKNGIEINKENHDFIILQNDETITSILKATGNSKEHSGHFKAMAINVGGEETTECNLTIKGIAPYFINKPEKITSLQDSTAILGCSFKGDPEPEIIWILKNKIIYNDKKYSLSKDNNTNSNILEINKCNETDEGTYMVTIKNIHGSETVPVTLIITKNAADVQDYRQFLKVSDLEKRDFEEQKPDWGNLKAGLQKKKEEEDEQEKIKLKKKLNFCQFLLKIQKTKKI